jgi:acyl-CoA synthetase (AMP-forming)/AMP-acid ligase II
LRQENRTIMTTEQSQPVAGRRLVGGRSIRWDAARAEQAYADGWWVGTTLADSLRAAAAEQPDRVLVMEGDAVLTAATLLERATNIAHHLLTFMTPGDVVSFMLPNWHEAAEIYLGATLAGMVAHPVLPSLRDHDLGFMLADVNSRAIFIPAVFRKHNYAAMLSRVVAKLDNPPAVFVLRGDAGEHRAYSALREPAAPCALPRVDADSVRMIMYTSGTTGSPKGVMHTHNSLHALIRQLGEHWLAEPGDRFLVPSPISHIGGSIYVFEMPLLLGTTAILMEQWAPDKALEIMDREGVTHMAGATPFLEALLAAARGADTRIPSLKVFICGGASVPPSLIYEAADYLERAVVTRVYGSTEVPVTTVGVLDRDDVRHAAETDGAPGIADVRLSDVGEICARGPQMLAGYTDVAAEAGTFDDQGYYRTGDQGRWIDERFLVVSGRIKDIIIRNGENIAPKEIEDILLEHPAIADIAIVGLPDPRTGERACAVIVPAGVAEVTVDDLKTFLDAKGVARFKFPESVKMRKSLPRNDAGKVVKHKIRADILAENA